MTPRTGVKEALYGGGAREEQYIPVDPLRSIGYHAASRLHQQKAGSKNSARAG